MADLLRTTDSGLYCEQGAFYIDPWRPVDRAMITHAHSDHARLGMGRYLCAAPGLEVLRLRIGPGAPIDTLAYGEAMTLNGVKVSFHPAGHILGSAQIRVEHRGEVWVASGDYKTEEDLTCQPFELQRCHTFITESTFGLPIYRWPSSDEIYGQINDWWARNQASGKASLLFGYPLGKSQRLLAGLNPNQGPIFLHGALQALTQAYRNQGIKLPLTENVFTVVKGFDWSQAIILAPPSANGTLWMRRFGDQSAGFASGWMAIRGAQRRRAVDRGFVLSDHVDWPALMSTISATGAERVLATHGYASVVSQYLNEKGLQSEVLATAFEGEQDEQPEEPLIAEESAEELL